MKRTGAAAVIFVLAWCLLTAFPSARAEGGDIEEEIMNPPVPGLEENDAPQIPGLELDLRPDGSSIPGMDPEEELLPLPEGDIIAPDEPPPAGLDLEDMPAPDEPQPPGLDLEDMPAPENGPPAGEPGDELPPPDTDVP
jgi:hypothetical protein